MYTTPARSESSRRRIAVPAPGFAYKRYRLRACLRQKGDLGMTIGGGPVEPEEAVSAIRGALAVVDVQLPEGLGVQ